MRQEPDTVRLLVEAAIMLHNLIRKHCQTLDVRMLDQADASTTSSLELGELPSSLRGNRDTELANRQRGLLKYYFKSAGAVALQDKMV